MRLLLSCFMTVTAIVLPHSLSNSVIGYIGIYYFGHIVKDRIMKHLFSTTALFAPLLILGACATTEPELAPVVVITPPIEQQCIPINTLRKVTIPAVTKSGYSIVSIESEDEMYYDPETEKWVTIEIPPIERKEPWTKIVTPEQVIYVDQNNKEVTDICELKGETP